MKVSWLTGGTLLNFPPQAGGASGTFNGKSQTWPDKPEFKICSSNGRLRQTYACFKLNRTKRRTQLARSKINLLSLLRRGEKRDALVTGRCHLWRSDAVAKTMRERERERERERQGWVREVLRLCLSLKLTLDVQYRVGQEGGTEVMWTRSPSLRWPGHRIMQPRAHLFYHPCV